MKKNKKLYIISGSVLLLLVVLAVVKSKTGGGEIAVTTEEAALRSIVETVSANGKVQPEVDVKISPDVSGEIVKLPVKEGDRVKKGELLVKINPDVYLSAKQRMEASLNTSRANLANSKARVAQSKAQFINAESSFKRSKKLWEQNAISDSEYDAAKSSYEVAKAEVEAAEQTVNASEFSVKSAMAGLKEAQDNLVKTTIFSPVDGTVSMLRVEQGERVVGTSQMAGTEMMRIADLNNMEVNVEVNENDIVRVNHADTADIEVDAYLGRKFKGIVTEIANSANTAGLDADQVTTFEVKIRILRSSYQDLIPEDKPHLSPFRPGMSATVEIKTNTVQNIVSVPIQAVTVREDTAKTSRAGVDKTTSGDDMEEVIFLLVDGKAKRQKVTTGIQDSKYIEIKSGLDEGQEIITGPYSAVSKKLDDGDAVEKTDKKDLYRKEK